MTDIITLKILFCRALISSEGKTDMTQLLVIANPLKRLHYNITKIEKHPASIKFLKCENN